MSKKDAKQEGAAMQLPAWVEAMLKEVYRQKDFAAYYRARAIALNVAVNKILSHDVTELRYRDAITKEEARARDMINDMLLPSNKAEKEELRRMLERDVRTVGTFLDEIAIKDEFKRRKGMYPALCDMPKKQ